MRACDSELFDAKIVLRTHNTLLENCRHLKQYLFYSFIRHVKYLKHKGWVPKEKIANEFKAMQYYSNRAKFCHSCIKQNLKCEHPPPTKIEKVKELKRQHTMLPFFIVMSLFFIIQFNGISAMTPFIVQIFKAYDSPIAPDRTAAIQVDITEFIYFHFEILMKELYFRAL